MSEISNENCNKHTQCHFVDKSAQIVDELKAITLQELGLLLGVSPKIAKLNWARYNCWKLPFGLANSRQAILSFSGDVYGGLYSKDFSVDDFDYSQGHIRILSGLYGLLRPLDLIQPYRLEMGSLFKVQGDKSLYAFWTEIITGRLQQDLGSTGWLVNLASAEYFKAVDASQLKGRVINIEFREGKPEGYKVVPILSKRARGLMARFAVKNKLSDVDSLKLFNYEGYLYSEPLSTDNKWVFVR